MDNSTISLSESGVRYEFTFVLVPKVDNPFFIEVFMGCQNEAFNLAEGKIRCVYIPPAYVNAQQQADLIRDVIANPNKYGIINIDGMAISVLDENVTGLAIDYATNQNIPVITFDSDAPKSKRLAYVGPNNSDFGIQLGEAMQELSPRGGRYAIITGTGPNVELRVEGVRHALNGTAWEEVKPPLNCYENSTLALQQMSDLVNNSTIKGIISVGGWPTFHSKWLTEGKFYVIGDASEVQIDLYYNTPLNACMGPLPQDIGRESLQLLLNITDTKQQMYESVEVPLKKHVNSDRLIWLVGKKEGSNIGFLDDVWKGCDNSAKSPLTCRYFPDRVNASAREQANLIFQEYARASCIAVSVLDENVTGAAIDFAIEKGIPVITFDSDAPNSKRLAYVGANNSDFGVKLGEAMKKKEPEGGKYVVITGLGPNLELRVEGIRHVLKDTKWVEVKPPLNCYENSTVALELMADLAEDANIQGIISVDGWPMDEAEPFKQFYRKYKDKKTFVIGGQSSTQKALYEEGDVVDELIGPSLFQMGIQIVEICNKSLGSLKPLENPIELLDIEVDYQGWKYMNRKGVGNVAAFGYTVFSVVALCCIALLCWTKINLNSRPVKASQPFFMAMLCVGSLIMASAMIPMSIDDINFSKQSCDIACMSIPWLLVIGFCTTFSALFAKTWRLVKITESAARFRRITVTVKDVLYPFFGILSANIVVLTYWTIINPLVFSRFPSKDSAESTYGRCISKNQEATGKASPYIGCLAAINFSLLILANWMAYRSRKVRLEFGESRYIAIVMFSMLQAFLIGIPLLFAVLYEPMAYYFVLVMLDFLVCFVTLCFMFMPKVFAHRKHLWRESLSKSTEQPSDPTGPCNQKTGALNQKKELLEVNEFYVRKINAD